jgi:hypothetical protein
VHGSKKHYQGMAVKRLIVHPAYVVASGAFLTHDCAVVRETELKRFVKHIREFFKAFEASFFAAHIFSCVASRLAGISTGGSTARELVQTLYLNERQ